MSRRWLRQLSVGVGLATVLLSGCGTPAGAPQPQPQQTAAPPAQVAAPSPGAIPPTMAPTLAPEPPTPAPAERAASFEELATLAIVGEEVASLALSPDGATLAYGAYGDLRAHLVDVATSAEIMALEGHTTVVASLAFSPAGDLLATAGTVHLGTEEDGTVRIWDLKTGEALAVFETAGVNALTFSPDGSLLAGAGAGQPAQTIVWDVATFTERQVIEGVSQQVAFSPDGSLLAVGARDHAVHLYDVASGDKVQALAGHTSPVNATTFSADGRILASGDDEGIIRLWDAKAREEIGLLAGHSTSVSELALHPAGWAVASLGSGLKITEQNGQIQLSFGSDDRFVRLWDSESGEQLGALKPADDVNSAAFSSDWSLAATGGKDIRLWRAGP